MNRLEQLAETARQAGCRVLFQEPMSRHTTFRIGGPADLFLTVSGREALQTVYRTADRLGVSVLPLGRGSNMLVRDEGIRGAVVALDGEFKKVELSAETEIVCGAGAALSDVCAFARDLSLTGLEFAWGIPGSAGGAAFMNAGAYTGEMRNVLTACEHIDKTGGFGTLKGEKLKFGYRRSAYTDNGCTILSLALSLRKGDPGQIAATMDDLYSRRKAKQPLELPSAGSVFKRPAGHYAGTLIDSCGLKGRRVGGAMVSEKHAGFIVNVGGATCEDVRRLIGVIQRTVFERTGVTLECEVKTIG